MINLDLKLEYLRLLASLGLYPYAYPTEDLYQSHLTEFLKIPK